uniref:Uncharacterized protein n=1 Tax=Timema bartmani TaxID=61472 RepID=A0A7R9F097_9NEOP|nr:unnamed protein product [Timema bartmani]
MCTKIWPAPPVARGQDVTRESIKSCWQVYNGMSSLFIRLSTTRGVLGGCSIHGHSATNMTRTGSITVIESVILFLNYKMDHPDPSRIFKDELIYELTISGSKTEKTVDHLRLQISDVFGIKKGENSSLVIIDKVHK